MGKTLRIGLTALGVTALTLTGCATARPLSVLPSSTWSAAVTADRAGRDFVSALRHGGVAEESLAALIDDGTTLGLELTATREPSLMPSRDDAAPQPTLVPALAGAAAAAALPTAALAATLADGNATTVRAPHVSVDGRIGSGRADVSLASADLDAVIAATSKQNLCPAGGRVRGVFRTDVAVDGASFTRAAAFSAVAADDRILSMTLTLHTEVELHDAGSTGSVTVAGTAGGQLDEATGVYSLRASLSSVGPTGDGERIDGLLLAAELTPRGSRRQSGMRVRNGRRHRGTPGGPLAPISIPRRAPCSSDLTAENGI